MGYLFQAVISCSEKNCIKQEQLQSNFSISLTTSRRVIKKLGWSTRKEEGRLKDYCPKHTIQKTEPAPKHIKAYFGHSAEETIQGRPGEYKRVWHYKCGYCGKRKTYSWEHIVRGRRGVYCEGNGLKAVKEEG